MTIAGGCACGAVRYEYSGEPVFSLNCHCRDCQRETGGAFAAILGVPKRGFKVTRGDPRHYVIVGGSGKNTTRAFCGDCGSALFGIPDLAPELITIRVGSLDDPSTFAPSVDIFTSSAQPWDHMNPALPKAAKLPDLR